MPIPNYKTKRKLTVSGTIVEDDWPYTIKEREYPEQSPVDISTKHAQRRFLPFLRCFGYWAFDKATVKITNNGHTGIRYII